MKHSTLRRLALYLLALPASLSTPAAAGTSLTPASGLAWSANTGWIDPRAGSGQYGLVIGQCVCTGHLYSANCGWINMGSGLPANGAQYANTGADTGVNRLPGGKLRGYAWGANIGWLNFEDTGDPYLRPNGQLAGFVWSPNIGWITLSNLSGPILQQVTDADGDGLPDAWENEYATTATLTASGDLDGDGATDADEYAAGTDPTEADSKLDIASFFENSQTVSLGWTSTPSRYYRVLTSTDLVTWTYGSFFAPGGNPLIAQGSVNFPVTSKLVLKPAGATRAFFKIIALKPPAAP